MDELLAKMELECKDYINNENYVFKECRKHIVVLDKSKCKSFESNEGRSGIDDKNFAKFRCNGLWCSDIINIDNLAHKSKVKKHGPFASITYEVGKFIRPDSYTYDINKVCASGISYFLTLKPALHYSFLDLEGERCFWSPSGFLQRIRETKNGKFVKSTQFNKEGNIISISTISHFDPENLKNDLELDLLEQ